MFLKKIVETLFAACVYIDLLFSCTQFTVLNEYSYYILLYY